MTKKLFYEDMYKRDAEATVISIEENRVILNQTIFFPEGGGQTGDTGWINDYRVVDTQKAPSSSTRTLFHDDFPIIQVDTDVIHFLEDAAPTLFPGQVINLKLDWDRRYSLMQMHSAAHVAYHFLFQVFGPLHVKGCYIQPERSRFDFGLPVGTKLDCSFLEQTENLSNVFIDGAFPILNVPLEDETEALYWVCNGIRIPCGGTHVRNTSEIGHIHLKRKSQGKSIDRVYISMDH